MISAAGAARQPPAFCPAQSGEKSPRPSFSAAARSGRNAPEAAWVSGSEITGA